MLLAGTQLLDNTSLLPVDVLLHENPSLPFPIISYKNTGYDINRDAKNVKLPGTIMMLIKLFILI